MLLRALPRIKNELRVNVELASPGDFVPLPNGWQGRSPSIERVGRLAFHHFDLYAQAFAKLERAHDRDHADVRAMLDAALIEPARLLAFFDEIEPELSVPRSRSTVVPMACRARSRLDRVAECEGV